MVDLATETPPLRVQLVSKPGSAATGIGRYTYELERGLTRVRVDVIRATLRTPIPSPVIRVGKRAGYDLDAFARSYPVRADVRAGYVTHLTSQTLAMLLLTQRLPRPMIVTVHDILPYVLRDDPDLCVYGHRVDRAMDALAMRGLKRADRLIADSEFTKLTLIDTLQIPADRIDVVYLGVDSQTFRPQLVTDDFWQRYGLDNAKRYVLYVGSEDPRKDLPTLLRAMAIVRDQVSDIEMIKVGAPAFIEQRQRNLALCQSLGIADAVHWIDAVSDEDLPVFYNAAAVFAFPSRYEGFGLPVLEALACGTSVVAAAASSVPELVGTLATLVPPQSPQAMAAAIMSELRTSADTKAVRINHATSFTWEKTIAATQSSYEIASRDWARR